MSRSINKKAVQKPKDEVVAPKPQANQTPVQQQSVSQQTGQTGSQPIQQFGQNPVSQTQQQPAQAQLDPNNEIVHNMQHKEEAIQELMSMGFDRHEVEKALAAAFYYKDRAVDYLVSVH